MVRSGVLIVLSMPFKYYLNDAFRLKMLLLVAAIGVTARLLRCAAAHRECRAAARPGAVVGVLVARCGRQRASDRLSLGRIGLIRYLHMSKGCFPTLAGPYTLLFGSPARSS
jgi:hypothetical protein